MAEKESLTMKALQEQLQAMNAEIARLKSAKETQTVTKISGGVRKFDTAEIKKFLDTPRPETEFFTNPTSNQAGQFQGIILVADEDLYDPTTQTHTRTPMVELEFTAWHGVGSEIRDPHNPVKPLYRIGHADLARHSMVVSGKAKLDVLLARMRAERDYTSGRIISGEAFRAIMTAVYAKEFAAQAADAEMRAKIAAMQASGEGDIKSGNIPEAVSV